jgi:type VI secretion system protein ImpG
MGREDIHAELKLQHDGFAEDQALLPLSAKTFSGHRLLQEAFILREKFRFITITGLDKALKGSDARTFDVIFGLKYSNPKLATAVKADAFRLHCAPAVNLFERRADRILITPGQAEHNVVVDRTRPQDFEVYDVLSIDGIDESNTKRLHFEPIFKPEINDENVQAHGFFSLRREERIISSQIRDTDYLGSNVYVRLSGPSRGPAPRDIDQLIVKTLCTNRSLPTLLHSKSQFTLQSPAPVKKINPIIKPTAPRAQPARDATSWNLINALSLNHLSFSGDEEQNAQWLTRLLTLFIDPANDVHRQTVKAYKNLTVSIINRRLPGLGPIAYGRGLQVTITADTEKLRGSGPFVLASVLERFFTRAVAINSFTQTVLKTSENSNEARWPARTGGRHII